MGDFFVIPRSAAGWQALPLRWGAMERSLATERRARRWLGVGAALLILACELGTYSTFVEPWVNAFAPWAA